MKIIKYVLIALGGLVILAGAVLAYIAATFDPNQYKPQIVQAVKERTQRTLKLEATSDSRSGRASGRRSARPRCRNARATGNSRPWRKCGWR